MSLGYICILTIEDAAVFVERPQNSHLVESIFLRLELPDFV
jgi:Tfp pilus assembly protein PilZ